jgi:hypothetical protein
MKNFRSLFMTLAVGITFALLGHCLAGCDGSGGPGAEQPDSGAAGQVGGSTTAGTGGAAGAGGRVGTDGGLSRSEAGFVSCPVPSPTGDQKGSYGDQARDTPYFALVSGDVAKACRTYVSQVLAAGVSPYVTADDLKAYVGVDCSDVAHDFQGASGRAWCIGIAPPAGATGSGCDFAGGVVCQVIGIAPMKTISNSHVTPSTWLDRTYGVCTTSGIFAGWICR